MTYTEIKNAVPLYKMVQNPEDTTKMIEAVSQELLGYQCEVKFDNFQDFIPFMASATDCEEHGRNIFADIEASLA